MTERILFLSHAAVDRDLAQFVEETSYLAIPDVQVFRASRVGQIGGGKEWFDAVTSRLRTADCYLVLLTEASMSKPWVCFETGAAWYTERPLKPVLAPGLKAADVPEPIRDLQLYSLGDPSQAAQVFAELGGTLSDPKGFIEKATALATQCKVHALKDEGWRGIDFEGQFYAFEGPLEKLPQADAVPMPEGLPHAFRAQGFKPELGIHSRLEPQFGAGFKRVWLLQDWKRKCPLLDCNNYQLCVKSLAQRK